MQNSYVLSCSLKVVKVAAVRVEADSITEELNESVKKPVKQKTSPPSHTHTNTHIEVTHTTHTHSQVPLVCDLGAVSTEAHLHG